MKTLHFLFALALVLSATLVVAEAPADANTKKRPELLLSMSANSGSYADNKLTLQGVPGVVWFTDRPDRKAGHLTL
ncbi:MAG: hypothetical protein V2J55_19645, partial [Candidatus Competibacteraceae bacterium]|nr:hypothetical protein [Candidatus Competibacteraceae bacterium]